MCFIVDTNKHYNIQTDELNLRITFSKAIPTILLLCFVRHLNYHNSFDSEY